MPYGSSDARTCPAKMPGDGGPYGRPEPVDHDLRVINRRAPGRFADSDGGRYVHCTACSLPGEQSFPTTLVPPHVLCSPRRLPARGSLFGDRAAGEFGCVRRLCWCPSPSSVVRSIRRQARLPSWRGCSSCTGSTTARRLPPAATGEWVGEMGPDPASSRSTVRTTVRGWSDSQPFTRSRPLFGSVGSGSYVTSSWTPRMRHQGIAHRLVETIRQVATDAGALRLSLQTEPRQCRGTRAVPSVRFHDQCRPDDAEPHASADSDRSPLHTLRGFGARITRPT